MRIGTAEPQSTFTTQGLTLKDILIAQGYSSSITIVEAQSSSTENVEKLRRGELDFAFIASNWIGKALRGERPFVSPAPISIVAPLNAGPMYFITLQQSAMTSIYDMRGKRVAVGAAHSGTCQHAMSILGALGISFHDIEPVYLDFATGAHALINGDVDAQLQCPYPNKVMTSLDQNYDLRVLSLSQDDISRIIAAHPIYRPTLMKRGSLRALTEDALQAAVLNVIITRADIDEALLNVLLSCFYKHHQELARLNGLYQSLPDVFADLRMRGIQSMAYDGADIHPAAQRFYQQHGFS
jgi:uncharacterized protein